MSILTAYSRFYAFYLFGYSLCLLSKNLKAENLTEMMQLMVFGSEEGEMIADRQLFVGVILPASALDSQLYECCQLQL